VKRRKKRGVYFINRPAPTERAWLLDHGATEEDLAFPDPKSDPLAGLFLDPTLKEKFAPLVKRLETPAARALLYDENRDLLFRVFAGVGPPDREGDYPEGLVLVRPPDPRVRLPGLPDDAPGARDLIPFYRGFLGALCGGDDRVGLSSPGEVLLWSKARKHDLDQIDFLPEHRTRNLRIFWDSGHGTEEIFDAAGRVYEFRGDDILRYRNDNPIHYLEEMVLRIAAGKSGPVTAAELEALAPGHHLAEVIRLREMDPEAVDPPELLSSIRRAEQAGASREELVDLHLAVLVREERWTDFVPEMRRLALGPARSLVDRPIFWNWLSRAAAALGRPELFSKLARNAAAGPLSPQTRGAICDILLDAEEIDTAIAVLEQWMRPGRTIGPEVKDRIDRIRSLRRQGPGGY